MKRHYEIEGVLYPASDWANWARINMHGILVEYYERPNALAFACTTELDRLCLRVYGSDFEKLDTQNQRWLENLYNKGALKL